MQEGSAEMIYTRPATEFVARFMGSYNLLTPTEASRLLQLETRGHLAIRPEAIQIFTPGQAYPAHLSAPLPATIRQHQLLGNVIRYQVQAHGITLQVDQLNRRAEDLLAAGTEVNLMIDQQQMREVH